MKPALAAFFFLISAATVVTAHHSQSAEFDISRAIEVKGTVVKFDWINPHPVIFLDAKDASGTITHWKFEIPAGANELYKRGIRQNSVPAGAMITGVGSPAKNQTDPAYQKMAPKELRLSGGTVLDVSSTRWMMEPPKR
jgi:hypothetical protein